MTNYAVIQNNLVTNVIVVDTLEIAQTVTGLQCVDTTGTNAGIGWSYDGTNFSPPVVEFQPAPVAADVIPE
jgi:hypothetical protein